MATTTGRPKRWMFSMCFLRFSTPLSRASTLGLPSSFSGTPPWSFNARTVATITTALGLMPALRHLMFRNFSAPRSAPKPASVTVYSESRIDSFVASTLLQPWAMLANGPPWMKAGLFSSVCTRFGLMASFNSTVIAPLAFKSAAVIGLAARGCRPR